MKVAGAPIERLASVLAVLLALTAAVYWPGLKGGFLFDDFVNIVDNKALILHSHAPRELFRAAMSSPSSELHRPLATLSFALDIDRAGLDPRSMKITNLAIHLLNEALVFLLVLQLWRLPSASGPARQAPVRPIALAAFCAAAWAFAPINLTGVLYVVQRMESLANLFVLAGLCAYLAGRLRQLEGRGGWLLIVSGMSLGMALGVLAKETALLLPLYAAVLEFAVLQCDAARPTDRSLLRGLAAAVVFAGLVGVCLLVWRELLAGAWQFRSYTLLQRELTEPRVVLDYMRWTLFPVLSNLGFYYDDYPVSTGLLTSPSPLIAMAILGAMALFAVCLRRRIPLACLGILWFFAGQSLTAAPIPLELVFEHRNYFPSLGLILAVAACGNHVIGRPGRERVVVAVGLAWVAFLAFTTCLRANEWSHPVRLAESLAAKQPGSPRTQYELGRTYLVLSKYDAKSPYTPLSRQVLERAARIRGASPLADQALLIQSARLGQPWQDAWWEDLRSKLAQHEPGPQEVASVWGLAHCAVVQQCRFPPDRIVALYLTALAYRSPSLDLMGSYADYAANVLGDYDLAIRLMRNAVQRAPAEAIYRQNLVYLLYRSGDVPGAMQAYAALRATVGDVQARAWARASVPDMLKLAR